MFLFPKENDFFENNRSLKSLVKTLEDYIEIQFDMESVNSAICALKDCSSEERREDEKIEVVPIKISSEENLEMTGILNSFKPLADGYENSKNSMQEARDSLWEIKNELGTYGSLMFLSPKLILSLEMVFSGAIIAYSKAFNSSQRRSMLNKNKIFDGQSNLLNFHNKIISLRNKQFAHSEYEYNKHVLKYIISQEEEEIGFEVSSHVDSEFWHGFDYESFYELVTRVKDYLSDEVNKKSNAIKGMLSESQLEKLAQVDQDLTSHLI